MTTGLSRRRRRRQGARCTVKGQHGPKGPCTLPFLETAMRTKGEKEMVPFSPQPRDMSHETGRAAWQISGGMSSRGNLSPGAGEKPEQMTADGEPAYGTCQGSGHGDQSGLKLRFAERAWRLKPFAQSPASHPGRGPECLRGTVGSSFEDCHTACLVERRRSVCLTVPRCASGGEVRCSWIHGMARVIFVLMAPYRGSSLRRCGL